MATILETISISAIVQIAILYIVIYAILKAAKGSRFGQALMGVAIIAAIMFAFTYIFDFDVLSTLMRGLLIYLAISSVVIFQPEIRRILSQVGAFGYFDKPKYDANGAVTPEYVVETLMALAEKRIGALIAFERGISLRGYEDNGVTLNADFTRELVTAIFTPPLPLHDGGMTICKGRIRAAHCVFPVSNNPDLIVSGMRHRAAVGLSEDTDSLVVVVSEESGNISVAHNGKLFRYVGSDREASVMRWVAKAMRGKERGANRILNKLSSRIAKGFRK